MRPYDFGADKLKATKAPVFLIFGDADGVRMEHIAEMYRLKGGGAIHGDMQPPPSSDMRRRGSRASRFAHKYAFVMPGLVPGIHILLQLLMQRK